jgi:hypothetical protein
MKKMKKIGIVTTYKNVNYGSKLQSYALQTILKKYNYCGENIQFDANIKNKNKFLSILFKPKVLLKLLFRKKYKARELTFSNIFEKGKSDINKISENLYKKDKNSKKLPYLQ